MSSYQGMASASGSCVPPDSPIVQIKSSLNGKYGLQSMFSLLLLVVLSLTLIVWSEYPLNAYLYLAGIYLYLQASIDIYQVSK